MTTETQEKPITLEDTQHKFAVKAMAERIFERLIVTHIPEDPKIGYAIAKTAIALSTLFYRAYDNLEIEVESEKDLNIKKAASSFIDKFFVR